MARYLAVPPLTLTRSPITASKQARRYGDGLETCFQILAENPGLGRSAEQLARDLRRFEHQSHIVFYIPEDWGVLIVRVLHKQMDVPRYF